MPHALSGSCAIVIPTVMNELNYVLTAKPEDIEAHILVAKRLLKELLDQTQKAVDADNAQRLASQRLVFPAA